MTTDNRALYWAVEKVPHWFNGSAVWLDENYRVNGHDSDFPLDHVVATPTGRRMVMLGHRQDNVAEDIMLMNRDREWTTHRIFGELSGILPSDVRHAAQLPGGVIFAAVRNTTIGDPVTIVSLQHDLERPARTTDLWASPTDGTKTGLLTGSMATPAWYDSQGRQVLVRNVQIQFRKWPTGVEGSLNEMQVRVRPLARWQAGSIDTPTQMWTEPSERSAPDGTDDSLSINFGDQGPGTGFQIEIPVMRGIAIREINVGCEVMTRRS
jgi:hypothetical protein